MASTAPEHEPLCTGCGKPSRWALINHEVTARLEYCDECWPYAPLAEDREQTHMDPAMKIIIACWVATAVLAVIVYWLK